MQPTQNQKQAFLKITERIKAGEKINLGEIMREVGYADATAINPELNLTSKKGFQSLMAKINDEEILDMFMDIVRDTKDKRARIAAGTELMKLKGRYETKVKFSAYEERDKVIGEK
ncbi:MAG: hypothetical protein ACTSQE_06765 [Candidatus Heimdallarchaeaceae archaeon]